MVMDKLSNAIYYHRVPGVLIFCLFDFLKKKKQQNNRILSRIENNMAKTHALVGFGINQHDSESVSPLMLIQPKANPRS